MRAFICGKEQLSYVSVLDPVHRTCDWPRENAEQGNTSFAVNMQYSVVVTILMSNMGQHGKVLVCDPFFKLSSRFTGHRAM